MASGPGPSAAPSTMRLEQAVALSYEARWLVDLRGRVMHASPAVHMLIGKSFAECSGQNMAELLLLPAAQSAQIEQCVANGTPFVDRVRLLVGESPFQADTLIAGRPVSSAADGLATHMSIRLVRLVPRAMLPPTHLLEPSLAAQLRAIVIALPEPPQPPPPPLGRARHVTMEWEECAEEAV